MHTHNCTPTVIYISFYNAKNEKPKFTLQQVCMYVYIYHYYVWVIYKRIGRTREGVITPPPRSTRKPGEFQFNIYICMCIIINNNSSKRHAQMKDVNVNG